MMSLKATSRGARIIKAHTIRCAGNSYIKQWIVHCKMTVWINRLSKMEVLKYTKKFGEIIGLCMRENAPRKEILISFLVNFVFVLLLLSFLAGTTALMIITYPDDAATVLFCLLETSETIALLCSYVMSIKQKSNLMNLFNDIQKLVWQSNNSIRNSKIHSIR